MLPTAEPPLLWVPGSWQLHSPAPRSSTEVTPALGHAFSCRESPQGASHLVLSRAGKGKEPGPAPGATNIAEEEGPVLGPLPAPGQRVPSIPGDSHSRGVQVPQSMVGNLAEGRVRCLLEKGRRAWRRASCSTSCSWDLHQTLLPFPFERGEKVELCSFLPLRSSSLGGNLFAANGSAQPLPPLPSAPLALGSPWGWCGHIQAWGKAQEPARG